MQLLKRLSERVVTLVLLVTVAHLCNELVPSFRPSVNVIMSQILQIEQLIVRPIDLLNFEGFGSTPMSLGRAVLA